MRGRASIAAALVAMALLAGCGGDSGKSNDDPEPDVEETTTTEAEPETPDASEDGLPTTEEDAPSGDWIMVRANVSVEPEFEGFFPGGAEARLYELSSECDDDGCTLIIAGGGEDGGFNMPGTEPITGDPIEVEPDGDVWSSVDELDPYGCSLELDGPYLSEVDTMTYTPVYDDGTIIGLEYEAVWEMELTDEGIAAGCPADSAATYLHRGVMVPSDVVEAGQDWSVDGSFVATREVTESEGYEIDILQPGAISTTQPGFEIELSGDCDGSSCEIAAVVPDGNGIQHASLTSDDRVTLSGGYESNGGCTNPTTGEVIVESGAYDEVTNFDTLIPIWFVDDEPVIFVGQQSSVSTPTELGMAEGACSQTETFSAWVYLVDLDAFVP